MSLPRRRELLGERAEEAEGAVRELLAELPDVALVRVLRWMARGLLAAQAACITQMHDDLAQAHRSPPGQVSPQD